MIIFQSSIASSVPLFSFGVHALETVNRLQYPSYQFLWSMFQCKSVFAVLQQQQQHNISSNNNKNTNKSQSSMTEVKQTLTTRESLIRWGGWLFLGGRMGR